MADMASAYSSLRLGIALRQLPFNPSISRGALATVASRRSLSLGIASRRESEVQVSPGPWRSSWRALCVQTMGVEKGVESGVESPVQVVESIQLTKQEEKIFEVLVATLQHFGLDTELRVAGGWVRDKLLGKDLHDIDIAIDNMLGKQFCEKVNEYRSSIGEETSKLHIILRCACRLLRFLYRLLSVYVILFPVSRQTIEELLLLKARCSQQRRPVKCNVAHLLIEYGNWLNK